jgi:hypothetical protein
VVAYRILLDTKASLLLVVVRSLSKSSLYAVEWSTGGVPCCYSFLAQGVFGLIQPPISKDLHAEAVAQKA